MVMNYHQPVLGDLVNNWTLAARNNQGIMQTTWQHLVMQNAGVPNNQYFWLRWDADLIPSNAFSNFVRLSVAGFNPYQVYGAPFPNRYLSPRPVELGSIKLGHAFVAVGANKNTIWLHDSAPVFASLPSIAVSGSWYAFRQRVVDYTQTAELITLTMMPDPRPETQRRGSIVLQEQDNDYPGGSSFIYRALYRGVEQDISRWQWNGSQPNTQGYYWDDPLAVLPNNNVLGNNLIRVNGGVPGKFRYLTRVANITKNLQAYTLNIRLYGANGTLKSRDYQLTVPPYSWYTNASTIRGEFDNLGIGQAGAYSFEITLWQNGVVQDAKRLSFVVN